MKFNFKIQPFQTEACDNIVRAFAGQPKQQAFSYRRDLGLVYEPLPGPRLRMGEDDEDAGFSNAPVALDGGQLLANIREIQRGCNIKQSSSLAQGLGAVSLDVEMETGTGKTYVYIKSMFELHRRYGWSKFIVVVPSLAIREGVKKSFEMTQGHFMELYGLKARYFVYSSANLHQLDEFSSGSGINAMIINIQAFATSLKEDGRSKESRIIYTKRDEFASRRPIDVIKANRPIVILDEPQKMSGAATQSALKNNFNPLFSLNFSATHKTSHNLIYVLDALDAFKKRLVKKIEVKGFEVRNLRGTDSYLYLREIITGSDKPPRARLEFEVKRGAGIKRETHFVEAGFDLYVGSGKLEQYKDLMVAEVDARVGSVSFSNGEVLQTGTASGDVNETDIRRIQIRETIMSHFDKEESLFSQGIKCLSLFFIDEVAKYRRYDDSGAEQLGEYGKIFEQEYLDALNERLTLFPGKYQDYLKKIDAAATHRGYFSIDKQGRAIDSEIKRGSEFSDDISAYDLILKNKERLLSFEEPTRFIFSHSALREGWDNPNVFQICTLKHSENATAKRQEVGRGLRLCVNRHGDRQDMDACGETFVHDVNRLTVIASESYARFVADLQSKIKEDLYDRPTKASVEYFQGQVVNVGGQAITISERQAKSINRFLAKNDYIDLDDNLTSAYHEAAASGTLAELPEDIAEIASGDHALMQAFFDENALKDIIKNGNDTKIKDNPLNDQFYRHEFQELWKRINKRYAYAVDFESQELIEKCIAALNDTLSVSKLKYTLTEGSQSGVEFDVTGTKTRDLKTAAGSSVRYDLVGKIAEGATLTRRTTHAIISGLKPTVLNLFSINPEEFISKAAEAINSQKAAVVVKHIAYKPSLEEPYSSDIFNMSRTSQEYAKAYKAKRAIQEFVFMDGTAEKSIERVFAEDLDAADEVAVWAKLPRGPKGFYIPTPVGNYSPDWAIAFNKGAVKHIFFIAETKGTMDRAQFRAIENAKIDCAMKLFNSIPATGVKYHWVDNYQSLLNVMGGL